MGFFSDDDQDLQSRYPDRPKRPIPKSVPNHPRTPWLASTFSPEKDKEENHSSKTTIRSAVNTLIITLCIIAGATPFILGIMTLVDAYN